MGIMIFGFVYFFKYVTTYSIRDPIVSCYRPHFHIDVYIFIQKVNAEERQRKREWCLQIIDKNLIESLYMLIYVPFSFNSRWGVIY